jgi:hypothetical protein
MKADVWSIRRSQLFFQVIHDLCTLPYQAVSSHDRGAGKLHGLGRVRSIQNQFKGLSQRGLALQLAGLHKCRGLTRGETQRMHQQKPCGEEMSSFH